MLLCLNSVGKTVTLTADRSGLRLISSNANKSLYGDLYIDRGFFLHFAVDKEFCEENIQIPVNIKSLAIVLRYLKQDRSLQKMCILHTHNSLVLTLQLFMTHDIVKEFNFKLLNDSLEFNPKLYRWKSNHLAKFSLKTNSFHDAIDGFYDESDEIQFTFMPDQLKVDDPGCFESGTGFCTSYKIGAKEFITYKFNGASKLIDSNIDNEKTSSNVSLKSNRNDSLSMSPDSDVDNYVIICKHMILPTCKLISPLCDSIEMIFSQPGNPCYATFDAQIFKFSLILATIKGEKIEEVFPEDDADFEAYNQNSELLETKSKILKKKDPTDEFEFYTQTQLSRNSIISYGGKIINDSSDKENEELSRVSFSSQRSNDMEYVDEFIDICDIPVKKFKSLYEFDENDQNSQKLCKASNNEPILAYDSD